MRTSTDRLNVSISNTGPYMFFNDGGTLGTYNTNTSSFPWFIELNGDCKFRGVTFDNISVENTRIKAINPTAGIFSVGTTTEQIIYLSFNGESQFIGFYPLGEDYNNNIYEFRAISSNANTVIRFRSYDGASIVTLTNSNITLYNIDDITKKYFKFQYIYRFPGGDVLNRFYQLI
jgi:hypothetical protein